MSALEQLGISAGDVLNLSGEAFIRFKEEYLGILAELYSGNDSMLSAISDAAGQSTGQMGSYIDAAQGYIDRLGGLGESLAPVSEAIREVDRSMSDLSSTASGAYIKISGTAAGVGSIAASLGEAKAGLSEAKVLLADEQAAFGSLRQAIDAVTEAIDQKTEAVRIEQLVTKNAVGGEMADFLLLRECIYAIREQFLSLNDTSVLPDTSPVDRLAAAFRLLGEKIREVSAALGVGAEVSEQNTISSIASAIQALNEISFQGGIIAQFDSLKNAVDAVTNAVGGQGFNGGNASGSAGPGMSAGAGNGAEKNGGGGSLTGAVTDLGKTARAVIGKPDAEGDGTAIGEFASLETAVEGARDAVGGGEPVPEESSPSLTASVISMGETARETLGEHGGEGSIGKFEEFGEAVSGAEDHVQGIIDGLHALDGMTAECTVTVKIETIGGLPGYASGTEIGGAMESMDLNTTEYSPSYEGAAHVEGKANLTGNWGVRQPGRALVGELGQELWVHAKSGAFETVGDNGPEFIDTERGDIIFNHQQTRELLNKGKLVKRGKAYANGAVEYSDGTVITPDGRVLPPYNPENDNSQSGKLFRAWNKYYGNMNENMENLRKAMSQQIIAEQSQKMNEIVNRITNAASVVNYNRNIQPVINQEFHVSLPNVTNAASAQALLKDLQSIGQKKMQINW